MLILQQFKIICVFIDILFSTHNVLSHFPFFLRHLFHSLNILNTWCFGITRVKVITDAWKSMLRKENKLKFSCTVGQLYQLEIGILHIKEAVSAEVKINNI